LPVVDNTPDKRENRSTGKLACLPAQKKKMPRMPKLRKQEIEVRSKNKNMMHDTRCRIHDLEILNKLYYSEDV
jgi:hypothetical protein